MLKLGSWGLNSESDPRWNCFGEDWVGVFRMPLKAKDKIEELKKELGEPPEDLTWNYIKR